MHGPAAAGLYTYIYVGCIDRILFHMKQDAALVNNRYAKGVYMFTSVHCVLAIMHIINKSWGL